MSSSADAGVVDTIVGRRSVRRFLPDQVRQEDIASVLAAASRAASGTNIQPWMVHVVTGAVRNDLCREALTAVRSGNLSLEYEYLGKDLGEPYMSRRRKIGHDLYEKYGIERSDYPARKAAMLRNFEFFGAPVGLFFTMKRSMPLGSWLDCGMFMQNVMIIARAHGLETCPQQAWCDVGEVVHSKLDIPREHIVLSGMALGLLDPAAPENGLISERVGVEEFTTWHS